MILINFFKYDNLSYLALNILPLNEIDSLVNKKFTNFISLSVLFLTSCFEKVMSLNLNDFESGELNGPGETAKILILFSIK